VFCSLRMGKTPWGFDRTFGEFNRAGLPEKW
jgi:hypothetical protein